MASVTIEPVVTPKAKATGTFVLRKVMWGLALLVMGGAAANGYITIEIQTGAPQQAAAGAIACFQVVAPYVIARALDALLRAPGE